MKMAFVIASIAATQTLTMAFSGGASATSVPEALQTVASGSNYDVVQRAPVGGVDTEVNPTKNAVGSPDGAALWSLMKAPEFAQIKNDFNSGKMIIVEGNADGKLSEQLLRSAFSAPGAIDVNQSQSNLVARAIVRLPGEPLPSIFSLYANYPSMVTQADIISEFQAVFKNALTQVPRDIATKFSRGPKLGHFKRSSPSWNGNEWTFTANDWYDNDPYGNVIGVLRYAYTAKRVDSNGSNYSEWEVRFDDWMVPGAANSIPGSSTSWVDDAFYSSAGVGSATSSEKVLSDSITPQASAQGNWAYVTTAITFSAFPSVSWNWQDAYYNSDITVNNYSYPDYYGAWNWGYATSSSSAKAGWTFEPGVSISNTSGQFYCKVDWKASFHDTDPFDLNPNSTSGDVYDSFYINDL
ncbi:MAG: hypothetical protein ACYCOU_25570 [Sulfobacillus sp.]